MDFISHALLPYLLGNFFKRNKEEVTAFVLGGVAPDFDVLVLWIQYLYPTFLLITHRGITHSFFFGFFTFLIILYLATRPAVRAKVKQFIEFEPVITKRTVLFGYAGILIHLFMDYVTTEGIPLLYPFTTTNYSAEIFFYQDIFLLILSISILIIIYKKPFQRKNSTKFLVIFLIFFLVLGTVRIEEKISAQDILLNNKDLNNTDISAYPTFNPFGWYVLSNESDKIKIYWYNGFEKNIRYIKTFIKMNIINEGEKLNFALNIASEMPQVKMFKWRAYAVAVNASFKSGVWFLEYYDPMQKVRMLDSPDFLKIVAPELGSLKVNVESPCCNYS